MGRFSKPLKITTWNLTPDLSPSTGGYWSHIPDIQQLPPDPSKDARLRRQVHWLLTYPESEIPDALDFAETLACLAEEYDLDPDQTNRAFLTCIETELRKDVAHHGTA